MLLIAVALVVVEPGRLTIAVMVALVATQPRPWCKTSPSEVGSASSMGVLHQRGLAPFLRSGAGLSPQENAQRAARPRLFALIEILAPWIGDRPLLCIHAVGYEAGARTGPPSEIMQILDLLEERRGAAVPAARDAGRSSA